MSAAPRSVEVTVSGIPAPRWRARARRFCASALTAGGFAKWEVGVLLCDDQRIAELNERYRGKAGPTDVLSFTREEKGSRELVAGDIAISMPALHRNAAAFHMTPDEELKRLLVHGILHLAGMDHGRGHGGGMLALQESLLKSVSTERIMEEPKR